MKRNGGWSRTLLGWMALLLVIPAGCTSRRAASGQETRAPKAWHQWQAKRQASVGGPYGWASLAGLHWLPEGTTSAGRAATNGIVLSPESLPPVLGTFHRQGQVVTWNAAPGVRVKVNRRYRPEFQLVSDQPGPPTTLSYGAVRLVLVERGEFGERLGIRVRDPESPARRAFTGIESFPYDPKWRIQARFVPHDSPRPVRFADITGGVEVMSSPGAVVFEFQGTEHRLTVVEDVEEKDLFVLFRDGTSGKSTYGSGRFLHAAMPKADGVVILDFNFAYTPPCAFTDYATCPLPPKENSLPFPVPAGERFAGHSH